MIEVCLALFCPREESRFEGPSGIVSRRHAVLRRWPISIKVFLRIAVSGATHRSWMGRKV